MCRRSLDDWASSRSEYPIAPSRSRRRGRQYTFTSASVSAGRKAALGAPRCRTGQSVLFGPSAEESRHHRRPIDGVSGPPLPLQPPGGGGGGQVAAEPGTPGT